MASFNMSVWARNTHCQPYLLVIVYMDYLDFYKDLLLEHTKEMLPDVFAAIELEKDPMSGVHFSRGIPKK